MIKVKGTVLKARLDERDFEDREKGVTRHIKNVIVTMLDDDGDPAEIKFYEPLPNDWEKVYKKGGQVEIPLKSVELPKGSSIPVCRASA